jgi:hypothetical protein
MRAGTGSAFSYTEAEGLSIFSYQASIAMGLDHWLMGS